MEEGDTEGGRVWPNTGRTYGVGEGESTAAWAARNRFKPSWFRPCSTTTLSRSSLSQSIVPLDDCTLYWTSSTFAPALSRRPAPDVAGHRRAYSPLPLQHYHHRARNHALFSLSSLSTCKSTTSSSLATIALLAATFRPATVLMARSASKSAGLSGLFV